MSPVDTLLAAAPISQSCNELAVASGSLFANYRLYLYDDGKRVYQNFTCMVVKPRFFSTGTVLLRMVPLCRAWRILLAIHMLLIDTRCIKMLVHK